MDWSDWLAEARRSLVAAEAMGQAGLYPEACFNCQQAAEKALKGYLAFQKKDVAKSHSLRELSIRAGKFADLKELIAPLDTDYAATRYIDVALKRPSELYHDDTYQQRLELAKEILEVIESWMNR